MIRRPLAAVSFRDPAGFVYEENGCILRQVNLLARKHYDHLLNSGLYRELTEQRLLIAHDEVRSVPRVSDIAYKVIQPQPVRLISYPFEWSFSQYQDAALLTLAIQRHALGRGMSLKDCSAYNVQFDEGRPVLIDTLSLEQYPEGQPWVAYRQFCQHFLAPLVLDELDRHPLGPTLPHKPGRRATFPGHQALALAFPATPWALAPSSSSRFGPRTGGQEACFL